MVVRFWLSFPWVCPKPVLANYRFHKGLWGKEAISYLRCREHRCHIHANASRLLPQLLCCCCASTESASTGAAAATISSGGGGVSSLQQRKHSIPDIPRHRLLRLQPWKPSALRRLRRELVPVCFQPVEGAGVHTLKEIEEFDLRQRYVFEFSLCLSQACLGKMTVFMNKWLKRPFFTYASGGFLHLESDKEVL